MRLDVYGISQKGSVREKNEDAILTRTCDNAGLFLVADGIGGRAHGEIVSGMLRDGYDRWWNNTFLSKRYEFTFQEATESLKEVLIGLNQDVVSQFGENRAGSTLALLFLFDGNSVCLSAGDSRIYRSRNFSFRQMTRDDVYGNQPGYEKNEEKDRNIGKLLSAIGIRWTLDFSMRTDCSRAGDFWFLCSDGVYRFIRRGSMRWKLPLLGRIMATDRFVHRIESEVEKNGSGDNYSMIFVRVDE